MGRERETERGGKRDIIREYEATTIELTTGIGRERERARASERDRNREGEQSCYRLPGIAFNKIYGREERWGEREKQREEERGI